MRMRVFKEKQVVFALVHSANGSGYNDEIFQYGAIKVVTTVFRNVRVILVFVPFILDFSQASPTN